MCSGWSCYTKALWLRSGPSDRLLYGALHLKTDFSKTTTVSIYQPPGNDARLIILLLAQERHWVGLGCEAGGIAGGGGAESIDLVGKHKFLISVSTNTEESTVQAEESKEQLYLRGTHRAGVSPFADQSAPEPTLYLWPRTFDIQQS